MQHTTIITRESLVQRVIELAKNIPEESTANPSKHSDALVGGAMAALELVKEASNVCPAAPLQAVSSIVLVLLDTVQTAKGNKKNLLRLASNSLEIAYVILSHYHNTATGEWKTEIPKDKMDVMFRFVEQAYSVYHVADKLRNRPWIKRFFSAKPDVDTIREFRETLDHARHVFELQTILETNRDARELRQLIPEALIPVPLSPLSSEEEPPFTNAPPPRPLSLPSSPTATESTTATRPLSFPSRGAGSTSTYISVGGNYRTVDKSVRSEQNNSGNTWNFEVRDSYNVRDKS